MISLKQLHTYFGPNPFSSEPIILLGFYHMTNEEIGNSARSMTAMCSNWFSYPEVPSSPEAACRFLANWSLSVLTEVRGYLSAAGAKFVGDRLFVWLGHHDEHLSFGKLQVAADLFVKIGRGEIAATEVNDAINLLWSRCRKIH